MAFRHWLERQGIRNFALNTLTLDHPTWLCLSVATRACLVTLKRYESIGIEISGAQSSVPAYQYSNLIDNHLKLLFWVKNFCLKEMNVRYYFFQELINMVNKCKWISYTILLNLYFKSGFSIG